MAEVYGLSAITAGRVRAVTRGDAGPAERLRDRPPAGQWAVVRCTGAGTGRVREYLGTGSGVAAGTTDVALDPSDGTTALAVGADYPAVRAGDTPAGLPRYVTPVGTVTLDIPWAYEPSEADPCVMVPATFATLTLVGVGLTGTLTPPP